MKEIQLIVLLIVCCTCHVANAVYSSGEFRNISEAEFCDSLNKPIVCDENEKYRTMNGICNNLKHPYRGAANTRLAREGKARYGDNAVPKSITGADLPSARLVSLKAFGERDYPDKKISILGMQMGQFVAHDLGDGVEGMVSSNECCTEDGLVLENPNANCFHIPIPSDDPIHKGKTCMSFTRHFRNIDTKCAQCGLQDQINRVTSYLDLSLNYGNNEEEMDDVRSHVDGKFLIDDIDGQIFPPHDPVGGCFQAPSERCFHIGDPRINIIYPLTIIHILIMREHNRIASELKRLNDHWDDERLFQEARKICIGAYQYIIYYEWLPQILGKNNMKKAGIYYRSSGSSYSDDYNENVDSTVYNEFTAGAFRYFHTQIQGYLKSVNEERETVEVTRISDHFFSPAPLLQGDNFQTRCRGMTYQPAESRDRHYDPEIHTFFLRNGKEFGADLKAIDIQRDRDHGLPSYNYMRTLAGLKKARNFDELEDAIIQRNIEKLKQLYSTVDDIDLSVGGALERPFDSSVGHGPTYHYIFLNQFYNTRVGDRFWFEFNNSAGAFTRDQLREIRKASMSRIICDNSGGVKRIQRNAFLIPNDDNNQITCCKKIDKINLSYWKEEPLTR